MRAVGRRGGVVWGAGRRALSRGLPSKLKRSLKVRRRGVAPKVVEDRVSVHFESAPVGVRGGEQDEGDKEERKKRF